MNKIQTCKFGRDLQNHGMVTDYKLGVFHPVPLATVHECGSRIRKMGTIGSFKRIFR